MALFFTHMKKIDAKEHVIHGIINVRLCESEAINVLMNTSEYFSIIENIKQEIKAAQYRATIHANSDLLLLYYDIGTVINEYKTWGNKFIDNLSYDIQIAFPDRKGYSVRNLKYMAKFAARFSDRKIVQEVLAQITWYHNIALMDKVKNNVVAEYFLKDISEPIGVSEYKITSSLPDNLEKQLPSVEDIQKRIR